MKSHCLFLTMFILISHTISGEIKNGYANEITGARNSFRNLNALLYENRNLSQVNERKISENMKLVLEVIAYHELTDQLLLQFKTVAPELYNEINILTDRQDRPVDVYIKFIPYKGTELKSWGTTLIDQSPADPDTYTSEYGDHTVSVKIWTVNNALWVLSHELGHVKYQVPNLARYVEFHKRTYPEQVDEYDNVGHRADDLSGQSSSAYEKRFRQQYSKYLKATHSKLESPVSLLEEIIGMIKNEKTGYGDENPLASLKAQ